MADGLIFTLDDEVRNVIQDAMTDLISQLGKPCRLIYMPRWENCENCSYDPIGKKSSNRAVHGAPVPFPAGSICPLCNGAGRKQVPHTEDITFLCNWEFRKFEMPIPNLEIRKPNSVVEVKGHLRDMPKVLRAKSLIVNLPLSPVVRQEYTLLGQPTDRNNIVQGKFFISYWQQVE